MNDYFYNPLRRDIKMVRGDTLSFGFEVQGLNAQHADLISFKVKETIEDDEYLFEVDSTNNISLREYDSEGDILTYGVRVPPSLTRGVEEGRYFYELELRVNNDIITLMKGRITVENDVVI